MAIGAVSDAGDVGGGAGGDVPCHRGRQEEEPPVLADGAVVGAIVLARAVCPAVGAFCLRVAVRKAPQQHPAPPELPARTRISARGGAGASAGGRVGPLSIFLYLYLLSRAALEPNAPGRADNRAGGAGGDLAEGASSGVGRWARGGGQGAEGEQQRRVAGAVLVAARKEVLGLRRERGGRGGRGACDEAWGRRVRGGVRRGQPRKQRGRRQVHPQRRRRRCTRATRQPVVDASARG